MACRHLWAMGCAATALLTAQPGITQDATKFANPPASDRPVTLYFWMNGNVTQAGIDSDMKAMKQVGLGGLLVFDGSDDIPKGPVDYLSPQWLGLMTHMMQTGKDLGLSVGMQNAPGWSSSGGPWIAPAQAMQQTVWTETRVAGGKTVKVKLAQPYTKLGFYQDAAILAYPSSDSDEGAFRERVKVVTIGGKPADLAALSDHDLNTAAEIAPAAPLVIEMNAPLSVQSLVLYAQKEAPGFTGTLEASDDGAIWRKVGKLSAGGERGIEAPGSLNFPAVTARFFRVTPSTKTRLADALLFATPRLNDWDIKSEQNFRMGAGWPAAPADQQTQYAIDPAKVVDLTAMTDAQGNLTWKAPKGQWTILRFGHTPTGKLNVAASDSGRGLEVDKLSAASVDHQFESSLAKVIKAAGPLAGTAFDRVEIDSYEAGLQNWTAGLPSQFRTRNGYDMLPYLPAITGRVVGSAETSDRFLFDYRRTLADLMADNYYGRMQSHVRGAGLNFLTEGYGPGPFDEMQVSGRVQMPMTEFWTRTPWTDNRSVKMVSSAAHTYGKTIVAAESFTGEAETSRWQDYPYAMKPLGDLMFTLGVNQIYFHRYAHQADPNAVPGMTMGPWGINLDQSNTWFHQSKPWLDYLSRSQYMLKQGHYVADLLYFVGEQSPNQAELMRPDANPDSNPLLAQYLTPRLPAGYAYDAVNAEVLLSRATVKDGRIVLPEGGSYAALVIPDGMDYMTPELAQKLAEMVKAGAAIVGPKPKYSLSLASAKDGDKGFKAAVDTTWSSQRVFSDGNLVGALKTLNATPDAQCRTQSPDGQIAWLHRAEDGKDSYFVANRQRRVEEVVCSFRVTGKAPQLWDPETGAMSRPAVWREVGGRTEVALHLTQAESTFVVFDQAAKGPALQWLARDGEKFADLDARTAKVEAPSDSFTLSLWAKPDIDLRLLPEQAASGRVNETSKFYLIPARSGQDMHGPDTAVAGLAVGRNGAYVLERVSPAEAPAVLVSRTPVAGWTHFALVYDHGVPSLYINGKLSGTGQKSAHKVFAGGSDAPAANGVTYFFEGEAGPLRTDNRALSAAEIAQMATAGPPAPPLATSPAEIATTNDGKLEATAWQSGAYTSDRGKLFTAKVAAPVTVDGAWHVAFQKDRGAPEAIDLTKLESLSHNANPGVRYFSGTATYSRSLTVPAAALAKGKRVYLDLGRVEVMASVTVNGKDLGTLWKPPYRVDITDAVKAGANQLSIAVTSLWPNRMIGDAQKPEIYNYVDAEWAIGDKPGPNGKYVPVMAQKITELPDWYKTGQAKPDDDGKVTFQTWKFFGKDEPLLDSGLLGPVRMVFAEKRTLD